MDAQEWVGRNPTDRAKAGVKKSVLVEGDGGPLAICIAGANIHDISLLTATLNAIVIERPVPTDEEPQHLCLDKSYDNTTGYAACEAFGCTPHIKRIGQEKKDTDGEKTFPARRWVVERTFAWLSRCRAVLVRWDKKAECYLAQVKLACALLWFRRLHRLQVMKPGFTCQVCPPTVRSPQVARQVLRAVWSHQGIENRQHWVLDMAFAEDDSYIRLGNAPHNMATLRLLSLTLLQKEKTAKVGVAIKWQRAGWDNGYLLALLASPQPKP